MKTTSIKEAIEAISKGKINVVLNDTNVDSKRNFCIGS